MSPARRCAAALRNGLLGLLAVGLVAAMAAPVSSDAPEPGAAGVDTSLPATESQVTVRGRGEFADLAVTVNQTRDLTNQAVSITWEGARPTRASPGRFGAHYLQMMQCWGEDDGSVPGNPGPAPEQCVWGATAGAPGGLPGPLFPSGFAITRIISNSGWENFDPGAGFLDTRTSHVWRPFRSVGGTTVNVQTDPHFNPALGGGVFWLNPYFDIVTSNEIAGARTGPRGKGADLFEVHTGLESSGLGCGQRVQPSPAGYRAPRCWLVVVPRGTPAEENRGTPFASLADQHGVFTSPLSPQAWRNRIAIPLEFTPVDSPCPMGQVERRIVGAELALGAVASWQPALCAQLGLPPFSYATVADASARQQLAGVAQGGPGMGRPGMIVVSRPLPPASVDPANPVVYAPISASGIVIGFNVERMPRHDAPPAAQALAGVRVAEINLTPRLVAKLLTQSYRGQVEIMHSRHHRWAAANPAHLGRDPDFLRFNPEFELLGVASARSFGGMLLPAGTFDAARVVWEWILADPEARAWLDGEPDPWGMVVNPMYATTAAANATGGAFGTPAPESFPKADPYCHQSPPVGPRNEITPPPVCGTDWMPYAGSFAAAARMARAADDRARIVPNPFPTSAADVWLRDLPQLLGHRSILALTDTASASRFGLQMARLSRAGDNRPDRVFVAPDSAGLTAGVRAMAPVEEEPAVRWPVPAQPAPGAYPLSALTYAAIAPLALDEAARSDFAAFVSFASGPGQTPGLARGQLPPGYVPLPPELRAQAQEAARVIRTLGPPAPPPGTPVQAPQQRDPPGPPGLPGPASAPRGAPAPAGPTGPEALADLGWPGAPGAAPGAPAPAAIAGPGAPQADEGPEERSGAGLAMPIVALGQNRFVIPALAALALLSSLAALEITKRPRRAVAAPTPSSVPAAPPPPPPPPLGAQR